MPYRPTSSRPVVALQRLLSSRLVYVWMAAIGVCLTLPSIRSGLSMDDYVLWTIVSGGPALREVFPPQLNLFAFIDGDPERTRQLIDFGVLPWWAFDGARLAFWRPATSLTHWLDFTLWPDHPLLMHLHSLLWFALVIGAVTLMYRRLEGPTWVAGTATLFYTVDGKNVGPASWVSSRNVLLAALFGALCLWAHDRWRRSGWRPGRYWGPALLALGLLSAEAAVATLGYLMAHAVFMERGAVRRRLLVLLPYGIVGVGWLALYRRLGYGVFAVSPMFVDPLSETTQFVRRIVEYGPILLGSQWIELSTDSYAGLGGRPRLGLWLAVLLGLTVIGLLLSPILRRDPLARFWFLGQLLALPPIVGAPLSERYTFFVGFGAMALVARFVCAVLARDAWRPGALVPRLATYALAVYLAAAHLVLSPIRLARIAATFNQGTGGKLVEQSARGLIPHLDGGSRRVIILKAPSAVHSISALFMRAVVKDSGVVRTTVLTCTRRPVRVSRVDARTMVVTPTGPQEFAFPPRGLAPGREIRLTGLTVQVLALNDAGAPIEIKVTSDVPLEDSSLKWLRWAPRDDRPDYAVFTPPAIGESVLVR